MKRTSSLVDQDHSMSHAQVLTLIPQILRLIIVGMYIQVRCMHVRVCLRVYVTKL